MPDSTSLIMDDCAIHKTAEAAAALKKINLNLNIIFMPKYSTWQLNPIERSFRQLERRLFLRGELTRSIRKQRFKLQKLLDDYKSASRLISEVYRKMMRANVHLAVKTFFVE